MGRCYDYNGSEIQRMRDDVVRHLIESEKPIPKKIKKHAVVIRFKVGDGCFSYPNYGWFSHVPEFKSRDDAERFLGRVPDMIKMEDNFWIEGYEKRTYKTKDDKTVLYHYEVHEYDYEEYEDGEHHTEYTPEEVEKLKEVLVALDKAYLYLRAFDYAEDESCFGDGRFVEVMNEHFKNYEEIDFDNLDDMIEEIDD